MRLAVRTCSLVAVAVVMACSDDEGPMNPGDSSGGDSSGGDSGGDANGGDTAAGDPGASANKVVFVTSTTHNGALGGTAGADTICAMRASEASLSGTFRAWLSTATSPVFTRLTQASGAYVRTDGAQIADDWADLTDGTLDSPINRDEEGNLRSGDVWTGTLSDGSSFTTSDCDGFTVGNSGNSGLCGNSGSSGVTWTDNIVPACSVNLRLYCFQQ